MASFHAKLYLGLLAAFLILDGLWLGLVAKGFYAEHLGYLLADGVVWPAAIAFYLLFLVAIQVFVVLPGLEHPHVGPTLRRGAFFGLVTYATYDLTNLATVRDWPLIVTLVDLVWGSVLCLAVSGVGYLLGRRLRNSA